MISQSILFDVVAINANTSDVKGVEDVETASMVTDNDISMSQSQEAMEIQTQRTTNTAISSIGNTTIGNTDSTTGSEVYTKAGGKGEFHHRQKNPRKAVVKEDKEEEKERQMEIFAHKIFNGNVSMVKKIKEAFDQCDKINPTAATAMLTNFCVQGCKEGLLRTVFGIGYSRYVRSRDGPRELDENSGRNHSAFGDAERLHLRRFVDSKFHSFPSYLSLHTYIRNILMK
jgi:hypothetical protein